jgi:AraC-like DNA-binding protein
LLSLASEKEKPTERTYKALMFARFHRSLHEHYDDPDYSATDLAAAHKISTQTLHSIFIHAKSTFRQELLSIRMDHARLLLDNPRFNKKTTTEIGRLVGFADNKLFMTLFNKTDGMSPTAYRAIRRS